MIAKTSVNVLREHAKLFKRLHSIQSSRRVKASDVIRSDARNFETSREVSSHSSAGSEIACAHHSGGQAAMLSIEWGESIRDGV